MTEPVDEAPSTRVISKAKPLLVSSEEEGETLKMANVRMILHALQCKKSRHTNLRNVLRRQLSCIVQNSVRSFVSHYSLSRKVHLVKWPGHGMKTNKRARPHSRSRLGKNTDEKNSQNPIVKSAFAANPCLDTGAVCRISVSN